MSDRNGSPVASKDTQAVLSFWLTRVVFLTLRFQKEGHGLRSPAGCRPKPVQPSELSWNPKEPYVRCRKARFWFWLCANLQGKSREWAGVRLSRKKRFEHMRILRHSHVYPPNYTDGQQAGRERERQRYALNTHMCIVCFCARLYIYIHIYYKQRVCECCVDTHCMWAHP